MSLRLPVVRSLALVAGCAGLVAIAPFGGGPAWAKTPTNHAHHTTKPVVLSGNWSGSYSGSYSGTFTLTWKESGNSLTGTIKISAFGNAPTHLTGTVKGKSITFGTVGAQAITYSGSFTSNSMSGTWKLEANGRSMGGGSWKASR
jgi:hypothetical protein